MQRNHAAHGQECSGLRQGRPRTGREGVQQYGPGDSNDLGGGGHCYGEKAGTRREADDRYHDDFELAVLERRHLKPGARSRRELARFT